MPLPGSELMPGFSKKIWEATHSSAVLEDVRRVTEECKTLQKSEFSFVFITGLICVAFCLASATQARKGIRQKPLIWPDIALLAQLGLHPDGITGVTF